MSPENNFIMIIQNLWMTITSSIGYIALIPFYQASWIIANSLDISKYFILHEQKPESVTSAPLAVEVERGFIDGKLNMKIWILYFNSGMLVVEIAQSSFIKYV